ncbi:putative PWWP domain-containing protein [Seiridium cardinale]
MTSPSREFSPSDAVDEVATQTNDRLHELKRQYNESKCRAISLFQEGSNKYEPRRQLLEKELQDIENILQQLTVTRDEALRNNRHLYKQKVNELVNSFSEFMSSDESVIQASPSPMHMPTTTKASPDTQGSDANAGPIEPRPSVQVHLFPATSDPLPAQVLRPEAHRKERRDSTNLLKSRLSAKSRRVRKERRRRTGKGISMPASVIQYPPRTTSFDEVFQGGKATTKHMIVQYPKDSNDWYVLHCVEHGLEFGRNPLLCAARHLNSDEHGNKPMDYSLAVLKLGVLIPSCYVQDKKTERIIGWEGGYEDDGINVRKRKYPVLYLEDIDIPPSGTFVLPNKPLLGWASVRDLQSLDLEDSESQRVRGYWTACAFNHRLQTIRQQMPASSTRGSENNTELNRRKPTSGIFHYEPELRAQDSSSDRFSSSSPEPCETNISQDTRSESSQWPRESRQESSYEESIFYGSDSEAEEDEVAPNQHIVTLRLPAGARRKWRSIVAAADHASNTNHDIKSATPPTMANPLTQGQTSSDTGCMPQDPLGKQGSLPPIRVLTDIGTDDRHDHGILHSSTIRSGFISAMSVSNVL